MESNCLANLGGINLTTRLVHENKGYHVWFVCLFIYTKHYIRFTQKKTTVHKNSSTSFVSS